MLGDARFIRTLRLQNLLSFGPDSTPIELGALNVLIGPNGSGKSNVIEAIDLLHATSTDLLSPIRAGGGVREWLWKGAKALPVAEMEATLTSPEGQEPLRHRIAFSAVAQHFELTDEGIGIQHKESVLLSREFEFFHQIKRTSEIFVRLTDEQGVLTGTGVHRRLGYEEFAPDQSVLSQRRDPVQYPEITYLGDNYRQFRLYRDWDTGRNSPLRNPQPVDQPNDFLVEDASNLGLVLNSLERTGGTKEALNEHLSKFYDKYKDFSVSVEGGTVQLFLREEGLHDWVPAPRLSDGTFRFLCLASVLCHPSTPPLICIEEPELGLHPDILPLVAEMLIEASQRTQIIVTTHSDILVDALSHIPEAVLVCEKESNASTVRRLEQDRLRKWLKEYSLGDLWLRGQLGGNRW